MYNTNSQIKCETSMLKSSLYDYGGPYILACGIITITRARDDPTARQVDKRNKELIFRNCAPFTDCISKINNT